MHRSAKSNKPMGVSTNPVFSTGIEGFTCATPPRRANLDESRRAVQAHFVSSCLMSFHRFLKLLALLLLPAVVLLTSCNTQKVCAGLNNGTGTANNSKSARKHNRGGYKSPREVEARDRQRKRIKNKQRRSGRKSRGGGNTTGGHRHFSGSSDLNSASPALSVQF